MHSMGRRLKVVDSYIGEGNNVRDDYKNIIGKRIQKLRRKEGLSRTELCNRLNLSLSTISNYENGLRIPKFQVLHQIKDYFGCSFDYLAGVTDIENIHETIKYMKQRLYEENFTSSPNAPLPENFVDDFIKGLAIVDKIRRIEKK